MRTRGAAAGQCGRAYGMAIRAVEATLACLPQSHVPHGCKHASSVRESLPRFQRALEDATNSYSSISNAAFRAIPQRPH